ncbi:hypothetical protein BGW36DRAFT_383864 [Talaromyces proteolyticus]|uniref:C2H2-type domain-containing protein n=1 Tax=Talaromyces proteolyticus TaxID=1131652 RepID=A0AAD4PY97_9EURO|nr:uncharacterized protein BGW36DRAFT_383864 [Talaromyces proteolyticus]KAH8693851.1 hypothetical protein BGW36DRAFT_383864 [Talaromyces proteolyticus]
MASSSLQPPKTRAPVTCPDCGRQFAGRYEFNRHLKPKIKCPSHACASCFRGDKKSQFIRHIRRLHAGQFDIGLCKRHFEEKSGLFPIPGACIPPTPVS